MKKSEKYSLKENLTKKLYIILKRYLDMFSLQCLGSYQLSFVALSVIMIIPNFYYLTALNFKSFLVACVTDITFCFITYRLLSRINNATKIVAKILNIVLNCIVYINSILLTFMIILYRWHDYHDILKTIFETSIDEIINLISFYRHFLIYILIILTGLVLPVIYLKKRLNITVCSLPLERFTSKTSIRGLLLFTMFLTLFINMTYFQVGSFAYIVNISKTLYYERREYNNIVKVNNEVKVPSCDFTSPNIVLVIGESFNKYHSSLYGYNKETNPVLEKEKNLIIFNDVITSVNFTYGSFCNFLSNNSLDKKSNWFDMPLFPCVLLKAGYNVSMWDNQSASCSFIEMQKLHFYNQKNKTKYEFDEDLINDFKKNELRDTNNLVIFHLMGQHFDYEKRYPTDRNYFNPNDYNDREDLSILEKQSVAQYDNATLYNDYVLSEIINLFKDRESILIYFSDHGEEIYDYRKFKGRGAIPEGKEIQWIRCNIDIPFMIYVSDSYRQKHPNIVERIYQSVDNPFEIDDLPHLIYDLAGIKGEMFDSTRSLISNSFNVHKKRYVSGMGSNRMYDYDLICNPN